MQKSSARFVDGLAKHLLSHPFLQLLEYGHTTQRAIRIRSMQDYYISRVISREFPRLVASIAAKISDPGLRHAIVVNLWEEHGDGDLACAHSSPTTEFIELQIALTEESALAGLDAFCYGNEYLTLSEFRPVEKACARAYPTADTSYFSANRSADVRHARDADEVILSLCSSESDLKDVLRGAEATVSARWTFHNDLKQRLEGTELATT